jgi:streptogramin lyase
VPQPDRYRNNIRPGPDRALWFFGGRSTGRITLKGETTEYAAPIENADPFWAVAGPDGALWLSGERQDQILRAPADGSGFKPRPQN